MLGLMIDAWKNGQCNCLIKKIKIIVAGCLYLCNIIYKDVKTPKKDA